MATAGRARSAWRRRWRSSDRSPRSATARAGLHDRQPAAAAARRRRPAEHGAQGELRGAGYIIEVPPDWNGELVMWAHGYRGEGTVLTVDPPGFGLRQHLLELGYAWAASSYDANGYDVESGVRRTRDLVQHFRRLVGRPERIYIGGVSMGGHVTARSIEQYPSLLRRRDAAVRRRRRRRAVRLLPRLHARRPGAGRHRRLPDPGQLRHGGRAGHQGRLGIAAGPPSNALGEQFRAVVIEQSGGPAPGRRRPRSSRGRTSCSALPTPDDGLPLAFNPGRVATNVDTDYTPDVPVDIDRDRGAGRAGRCPRPPLAPRSVRSRSSKETPGAGAVAARPRRPVRAVLDGAVLRRGRRRQRARATSSCSGRSGPSATASSRRPRSPTAFDELVTWVEDGVRPEGDAVTRPGRRRRPELRLSLQRPHGVQHRFTSALRSLPAELTPTRRSPVAGRHPPVAVLGEDEVGGAIGGDDLEAGEAAMAWWLPPPLVERPRSGPAGDGLGGSVADRQAGRRRARARPAR